MLCGELAALADMIDVLVEDLCSLRQPWQGRFMHLVAHLATGYGGYGRALWREQLVS